MRYTRARGAFTLIEVVLALGLIIVLLGSMMTFVWDLADRRTTLSRAARDVQAGGAIIERIEADLLSGLAGDDGVGAGVKGTETNLRLLTRGVWMGGGGEPAVGADVQGSEYKFDPLSGHLTGRRWSHRDPGGGGELVSDRVERIRFRYFDGREWRSEFDSLKEGSLPVAIEVAVWFTALKNETAPGMTGDLSDTGKEWSTSKKWPEPDRLRVIIVPDGPQSAWSEGA